MELTETSENASRVSAALNVLIDIHHVDFLLKSARGSFPQKSKTVQSKPEQAIRRRRVGRLIEQGWLTSDGERVRLRLDVPSLVHAHFQRLLDSPELDDLIVDRDGVILSEGIGTGSTIDGRETVVTLSVTQRRRILESLALEPMRNLPLSAKLGIGHPLTSHHTKVMISAGVLTYRDDNLFRVSRPHLLGALSFFSALMG